MAVLSFGFLSPCRQTQLYCLLLLRPPPTYPPPKLFHTIVTNWFLTQWERYHTTVLFVIINITPICPPHVVSYYCKIWEGKPVFMRVEIRNKEWKDTVQLYCLLLFRPPPNYQSIVVSYHCNIEEEKTVFLRLDTNNKEGKWPYNCTVCYCYIYLQPAHPEFFI